MRVDSSCVASKIVGLPDTRALFELLQHAAKHPGYWLEQFILYKEPGAWRWNTSGAAKEVGRLVRQLQH